MEKKFNSISEEGKALVMEFMATVNGECERKEIVAYVKEHISNQEKLSDGVMAGVIKMLTASGELVVVNRARYKKGVRIDSLSLKDKVVALFENFQRDLNKACTVNLLEASVDDMEFVRRVSSLSNELESKIWQLGEEAEEKEPVTEEEKPAGEGNPAEMEKTSVKENLTEKEKASVKENPAEKAKKNSVKA